MHRYFFDKGLSFCHGGGVFSGLSPVMTVDGIELRLLVAGGDHDRSAFGLLRKKLLHEFRPVVIPGEMRGKDMAHIGGPVPDEQFQRLPVRQMSLATADPVLQKMRVAAFFEHLLVIVGFEESRMTLPEMVDQLL